MKLALSPQILALCTALAWGIGGFFEKKGLLLGDLSPQIGITVRTAVALLILAVVSFPQWKSLLSAEPLTPKTVIGMGNRSSLEMMTARRFGTGISSLCDTFFEPDSERGSSPPLADRG